MSKIHQGSCILSQSEETTHKWHETDIKLQHDKEKLNGATLPWQPRPSAMQCRHNSRKQTLCNFWHNRNIDAHWLLSFWAQPHLTLMQLFFFCLLFDMGVDEVLSPCSYAAHGCAGDCSTHVSVFHHDLGRFGGTTALAFLLDREFELESGLKLTWEHVANGVGDAWEVFGNGWTILSLSKIKGKLTCKKGMCKRLALHLRIGCECSDVTVSEFDPWSAPCLFPKS